MIDIKYKAESFSKELYGSKLHGKKTLSVDWHDLVWAAVTVGKRNRAQITKNGIYSIYEIINRSSLIWFSLRLESGQLVKTDIYKEMDPTEKVFVSFSLGMAIAKLFSEKLLNTPWLEHVANIDKSISISKKTKSRPDLIGLNHRREFLVVEAKGRTNNFDKNAQNTAKNQTKVISMVAGQPPVLRVASQSYFKDYLKVYFEDPEGLDHEPIEISTDTNSFLKSYYGVFQSLTDQDLDLLKPLGVEIDFDLNLKSAFSKNDYRELQLSSESYFDEENYKVFPDGIKIKLNENRWGENFLRLNPQDRLQFNRR